MPSVQSLISLATLASRAAAQNTTCLALDGPDAVDTNVVQTKIAVAPDVAPDDADGTTPYITGWFTAVYREVDGTAIPSGAKLDFQLKIYESDNLGCETQSSSGECPNCKLSWNIHREWTHGGSKDWASGATDCGTGAGNPLGKASVSGVASIGTSGSFKSGFSEFITTGDVTTISSPESEIDGDSETISPGSVDTTASASETTISKAQDGKLNNAFPLFTEFQEKNGVPTTARSILFTLSCDHVAVDDVFCARLFPSTVKVPEASAPDSL